MAPDADAGKSLNSRPDPFAPLTSQLLPVGDGHEVYVESVGRADGIPAVYLHGGPGSGCQPDHRRLFDPERFHAVLFEQRGAGRSRINGLWRRVPEKAIVRNAGNPLGEAVGWYVSLRSNIEIRCFVPADASRAVW